MKLRHVPFAVLALTATAALAHQGVKNPAVMARMNGMSAIADGVKVLGTMSKGQRDFDIEQARAALRDIASHSAESVVLFTPVETDPKSEALPIIWDEFDAFSAKAMELQALADSLAGSVGTLDDVRAAMGPIGATCKSCHSRYRE